ncbi:MAG TPA: HDOD domain-containing protein [Acidobacteriaceae bacterium]|nr:HDOD domain-containing protein [Acidobacteriaceae bacterium]
MRATAPANDLGKRAEPGAERPCPVRYLGRQPIVDEKFRLYGYELLNRGSEENEFCGSGEHATREVVDHSLMLMPDPTIAFVNCTRAALVEGAVTVLPPAQTVLEILEDIQPDKELLRACRALKSQGYRLALDDFAPLRSRVPFIELADFVKIDYRASDARARREIDAMLKGSWALRIAEKIETEEEMRMARKEGCMLFQGYFFSRPLMMSSSTPPQNRMVYLRLLAVLQESPADLREVESLVLSDTMLCYRVLRMANSAMQGHPGAISTVREALLLVGDEAVRRMVTVALAAVLGGHRPQALVSMALARARFCELLAQAVQRPESQFYLLGMLSLLDALLEMPMPRIVSALPLDSEMKAALLGEPGPMRTALELVQALELCDWERCEKIRGPMSLTEGAVATMYVEALGWVARALQG